MNRTSEKLARFVDSLAYVASPAWYHNRQSERHRSEFASSSYEALDNERANLMRNLHSGPADLEMDETTLAQLRDTARWLGANDSLGSALLDIHTDFIVGDAVSVRATTGDKDWDDRHNDLWREEMTERGCDVTGEFSFPKLMHMASQSYYRDGDFFLVRTDDGPQCIEGDRVGTPFGGKDAQHFDVVNGVAKSKKNGRPVGYYIGKPNKWGYVESRNWKSYPAERVIHVRNPKRCSLTRGEPVLTPSVKLFNMSHKYFDAELWAATMGAMLSLVITGKNHNRIIPPSTKGNYSGGKTDEGTGVVKLQAGGIVTMPEGQVTSVTPNRPPAAFDMFTTKIMMLMGRPLCMPLSFITGDFSGATYMNMRIAMRVVESTWHREQTFAIKPTVRRLHGWWLAEKIRSGKLKERADGYRTDVICKTWPSADRKMDAQADKIDLANGTISKSEITRRRGVDYEDEVARQVEDRQTEEKAGLTANDKPIDQTDKEAA